MGLEHGLPDHLKKTDEKQLGKTLFLQRILCPPGKGFAPSTDVIVNTAKTKETFVNRRQPFLLLYI